MGLFRKSSSVLTFGLIDFRSDKERIARYTRQTRNATRALGHVPPSRTAATYAAPAPGWYPSPDGAPCARWWDGRQWTGVTHV